MRLLGYLDSCAQPYSVFVCDSSDSEMAKQLAEAIGRLGKTDRIHYRRMLDQNLAEATRAALKEIDTPYCSILPDDDSLIPSAVSACTAFLEEHPQYASATGQGYIFTLGQDGPFGALETLAHYPQRAVESVSATERLFDHLANYTVSIFGVHRSEILRSSFKLAESITVPALALELTHCAMAAAVGNIACLDIPFLFRQDHKRRYLLSAPGMDVLRPDWTPSYLAFRDGIAKEVSMRDNTTQEDAIAAVDKAFYAYLSRRVFGNAGLDNGRICEMRRSVRSLARQVLPSRLIRSAKIYKSFNNICRPASPRAAVEVRSLFNFVTASQPLGTHPDPLADLKAQNV